MNRSLEDQATQFRLHTRIIEELAVRHPDWNIIVKVHPAEGIKCYLPMVEGRPNLYLGYNRSIRDYLVSCDVLLQRNCTTATEAWILEKPVLDLEIGDYHDTTISEHKHGSHVVTKAADVELVIEEYLAGAPIPEEQRRIRKEFLRRFYYQVDGRSSERCAERLHRLVSAPLYTDEDAGRTRVRVASARRQWKQQQDARLVNRLKDALGIDRGVSLRFWKNVFRREAEGRFGRYRGEPEITPEMTDALYESYDRIGAGG